MFRRVLEWLGVRSGPGEESDTDEGAGFVPSPLDRSVRYAHGGSDDGERAIAEIEEQAKALEERRRND